MPVLRSKSTSDAQLEAAPYRGTRARVQQLRVAQSTPSADSEFISPSNSISSAIGSTRATRATGQAGPTGPATSTPKRHRCTKEQTAALKGFFQKNPSPCSKDLEKFAAGIKVPYKSARIWFQNHRYPRNQEAQPATRATNRATKSPNTRARKTTASRSTKGKSTPAVGPRTIGHSTARPRDTTSLPVEDSLPLSQEGYKKELAQSAAGPRRGRSHSGDSDGSLLTQADSDTTSLAASNYTEEEFAATGALLQMRSARLHQSSTSTITGTLSPASFPEIDAANTMFELYSDARRTYGLPSVHVGFPPESCRAGWLEQDRRRRDDVDRGVPSTWGM